MEVVRVLVLVATLLACGHAYSSDAAVTRVLENDFLDAADVGESVSVSRRINPDNAAGGGEAREEPRFPYIDPIEDEGPRTRTKAARVRAKHNATMQNATKSREDPSIDFNKALLAELRHSDKKPACDTTVWGEWSPCEGRCKANQLGQTGESFRWRTRELDASDSPRNNKQQMPVKWKMRLARAKRLAKQAEKGLHVINGKTETKIDGLKAKRKATMVVAEKLEFDAKIAKAEAELDKAKKRASEANSRLSETEKLASAAVERQIAAGLESDAVMANALNRPPYCKKPKMREEQKCAEKVYCPVDCKVTEWEAWPTCRANKCDLSLDTQISSRHRTRSVLQEPLHGGKKCPFMIEQQPCTDVSCVWKVSEESKFKLDRCSGLLTSTEFGRWTQLWTYQRDLQAIRPLHDTLHAKYSRQVELLQEFDSFQLNMNSQIQEKCQTLKQLNTIIKLEHQSFNVERLCLRGVRKVCTGTKWPIHSRCLTFAEQACNTTSKEINDRLDELLATVSGREQRMSQAAGERLFSRCMKLSAFSKMYSDALFSIGEIREGQAALNQQLRETQHKLEELEFALTDYSQKVLTDDVGGTWACSRKDGSDPREQAFECVKRNIGPPYEAILCKGKQVGRILQQKSSGTCPAAATPPRLPRNAGEATLDLDKRQEFRDMYFGCPCPQEHQQRNTQCCRKGEDTVTTQVAGDRAVTSCQCPVGTEFVTVASLTNSWREDQCRWYEQKVPNKGCDSGSLLRTSGSVCCKKVEGQCRPLCMAHEFRMLDGSCMAAAKFGCLFFNQTAYQKGEDVPCLLPLSEAALTKDECLTSGGNATWERFDGDATREYCKRPQAGWTTLYRNCTFDPQQPVNQFNCAVYDKRAFFKASPSPGAGLTVDYFAFVSETALYTAGLPATQTGLRKVSSIEDKELPVGYTTFHPSEDIEIEDKVDQQERDGVLPGVTELLETSEQPKHADPFVYTRSSFSMSMFGGALDKNNAEEDANDDDGDDTSRRLLSKDGFDPIGDGASSGFASQLGQLQDATKQFKIAMGKGTVAAQPEMIPGGQRGKQSKVCVPPPDVAACIVMKERGVATEQQGDCLSSGDMAWFRIQCAQY